MLERKYEIEYVDLTLDDLNTVLKLTKLSDELNTRLETILYGEEESGRRTKINSIVPLYNEGILEKLLILFEKEEQIGVLFDKKVEETESEAEEVLFYPKEYLSIFKVGNDIALEDEYYKIKRVVYDLDNEYILLRIELE